MKENPRSFSNKHNSKLDIFESGVQKYQAFVFFKSNGEVYASSEDIHELDVDVLINYFMTNEAMLVSRYKMVKSKQNRSNLFLFGLLIVMGLVALCLSNFDWKLILMMLPIISIIGFRTFFYKK